MTTRWAPQPISFSRDDGLPKYVAVSRAIALAITERELTPGTHLPRQKELADSFGVTLMTVRQAIATLTEQGLLTTDEDGGTVVRTHPHRLALGSLSSFAEQVRAAGRELTTTVLGHGMVTISPIEQRRMGLPTPRAHELVRLRLVDGDPLILQSTLLPPDLADRLDLEGLGERSLYDMLAELDAPVVRATETIQATSLDADSARLLRRQVGEAALLSARLTFTSSDRALCDDRALTAGDSVVVAVERRAGDPDPDLDQLVQSDPIDPSSLTRGLRP